MLHTSPPSVPSHTALTENPEAETRSFLDFFFTKQNRETDIRTTQKPTFRTPPTPLRHASTPLPIPQNGLCGEPESPFHDAERAVSQRERASLAVPKSPSGNAGQYFPHCQKHHKESKPLNINNLEKPLKKSRFPHQKKVTEQTAHSRGHNTENPSLPSHAPTAQKRLLTPHRHGILKEHTGMPDTRHTP